MVRAIAVDQAKEAERDRERAETHGEEGNRTCRKQRASRLSLPETQDVRAGRQPREVHAPTDDRITG